MKNKYRNSQTLIAAHVCLLCTDFASIISYLHSQGYQLGYNAQCYTFNEESYLAVFAKVSVDDILYLKLRYAGIVINILTEDTFNNSFHNLPLQMNYKPI